MNHIQKLATIALVSLSAVLHSTQAKADERDGTIERFVCLASGVEAGHLNSEYVKLNDLETSKKFGFGGGGMALKLSNDGLGGAGTFDSYAGGAATFARQKKESNFRIFFKPVGVNPEHCRLFVCVQKSNGQPDYLYHSANAFTIKEFTDGWYTVGGDLADRNPVFFKNATITRVTFVLNKYGDNGYILMGKTQVFSRKDTLEPSKLIIDSVQCAPDLVCGALSK